MPKLRVLSVKPVTLRGGRITPRKTVRNVAAGYMDEDGVFHPIRKSWDYSYTRAGETGSDWHKGKGPVKSKAKRALKSKNRKRRSRR